MSPEPSAAEPIRGFVALRERGERLGERLPGLLVEAERVAATVAQGVHGRRRTGIGETFWQFRPYQAGDAASDIDWRQSARSQGLFLREQEWEAAQSVWIWCDLSRSMRFKSASPLPTKLERVVLLGLALAVMLIRGGERVALLLPGERPRGGRQGLETMSRAMLRAMSAAEALPPPVELPRFARLVLLSDLLEPIDELKARIGPHVARGVQASLLQVLDPAEETLPYQGRVLFEGLEAEGNALIRNVGTIRSRYTRRLQAHRELLQALAARWGWLLSLHRTDRPPEPALLALYQMLAPRTVR
jgi:uncharacterized protein (DUF58 family)